MWASPVVPVAAGAVVCLAVVAWLTRRAGLAAISRHFAGGFTVLRHPLDFLRDVLAWKVLGWVLRFGSVAAFLLAFGLPAAPATVLAVVAAQALAGVVPLLPGNAGTQQAAIALALAGVATASTSIAFAVGMQAATVVADLAVGVMALPLAAPCAGSLAARLTGWRSPLADLPATACADATAAAGAEGAR